MAKLLMFDHNGEPWLDNPLLLVANPRKRGKRMARRRRARKNPGEYYAGDRYFTASGGGRSHQTAFASGGGSSLDFDSSSGVFRYGRIKKRRKGSTMARRRKRARLTYRRKLTGAATRRFAKGFRRRKVYGGIIQAGVGKRRKRGRVKFMFNKRHRRRYASNPGGGAGIALPFGLSIPSWKDVAFGMAGLAAPPMLTAQVMKYVPDSLKSSPVVTWIVRLASVLVPGLLIKKFYDARAGYMYMIGGAATLAIEALKQFAPSLATTLGLSGGLGFGQPFLGYYPNSGNRGRRGQLGYYAAGQVASRSSSNGDSPMLQGVPKRLNPAFRF